MEYNLNEIKSEIVTNCKKVFDRSLFPTYSDFEPNFDFNNGVDIFFQVVLYKSNVHKLDGLPKTLLPALQEALISKKGHLNSLKIIIEELEPFLKKLILIKSNHSNDYSNDHSKGLMFLMKHLRLSQDLLNGVSQYSEQNLDSFKSQQEFAYFLCNSYLTRNQIHNSPNWDFVEVATNLRDVLVVYLYSTFKHLGSLKGKVASVPLPSQTTVETESKLFADPKFKPLYDFISYNHTTFEIRTEIVKSFILHFLSNQTKTVKIDDIQKSCNSNFRTTTNRNFYERTLRDLSKNGKVLVSGLNDDQYEIQQQERQRINDLKEFFVFQKEMFVYEITEVLKKYNIPQHADEIVSHLKILFEKNYNIDIQHIVARGSGAGDNTPNLKLFFTNLKHLSNNQDSENLLKDVMMVCGGNDFIHRITAGQAFSEASDLSQIEQYLRESERVVYLDANVVLYALCYWYYDSKKYENIYYKVVRDLIQYCETTENVILKTTTTYAAEVAFHFKEALLLAPIDEIGLFGNLPGSNSNNVFYRYYLHLKNENLLEENVDNFFDFLAQFDITEDLLYEDRNFVGRATLIVEEILASLSLEAISLQNYNIESSFETLKNSLKYPRSTEVIAHDAKMLCFLSDKSAHGTEPIFATWDTVFFDARDKYLKKHKTSQMWHLFTPSKVINHFQLLDFKINAETATSDYLTIIDNFKEKTKSTLDAVSDLLNINKEERRRYINKLKEFNEKFVFNLSHKEDPVDDTFEQRPVEKLLVEINKYYNRTAATHKYSDVKLVFDDKEFFDQVVSIFESALDEYVKTKYFSAALFPSMDALIEANKQKLLTKRHS